MPHRVVTVACTLALLAACGATTLQARSGLTQDEVLQRVSRVYTSHCGPGPLTLEQRLPNTTIVSFGQEFSASDVAVRGDVISVEKGFGFRTPPVDAPADLMTSFDDRRSTWKTIHLTVRVTQVLAGEASDEIRVGLTIEGDTSMSEAQELLAVDDAVFLLNHRHPFYDYDASLLGSNPDVIATIDSDGRLALPVLADADEQRLLAGTPDLPSLVEAGGRPQRRLEQDIPGCA